ncbi:hypothetical protein VTJ04DRAFT_8605 [Mycothermus thermophilus]|uniref:uncharacterized protein n=1 Tax=Humicola insolens TaxID=85995 RepID=UPI003742F611
MATPNPNPVTIHLPSKYTDPTQQLSPNSAPPLPFLYRTWTVTHSTLSMWRSARNVRITYGELPPLNKTNKKGEDQQQYLRMSDLVEYESASGKGGVKSIEGIDTATSSGNDGTGAWDWKGKNWLLRLLAGTSHWEVLGWGERVVPKTTTTATTTADQEEAEGAAAAAADDEAQVERWMVTWFAPTLFTAEGLDVYSDRKEGGSKELVEEVLKELGRVTKGKGRLGELVEKEMRKVKVELPWKTA